MGFGNYPPGFSGDMLESYFEEIDSQPCCQNCREFDGDHCMKHWNNLDPAYYIPDRDDKEPDDYCDDWEGER